MIHRPLLLTVVMLVAMMATFATGQEFRIETQVYSEKDALPVAQNTTLFSQGLVYDFQMSNEASPKPIEIVIYDSRQKKMVLLDPKREVRLELLDLRIMKILEAVRRDTQQDQRSSFLVAETFVEDTDLSTGWVTLTSQTMTYRFKGQQPSNVEVLPPYLEFLDMFTQLIASDPHKIPPFARLKLNQSIRNLGWLPSEVHLSMKPNPLTRSAIKAHSKHVLYENLSGNDRQRIELAKRYWMQFRQVNLATYRGFGDRLSDAEIKLANFEREDKNESAEKLTVSTPQKLAPKKANTPSRLQPVPIGNTESTMTGNGEGAPQQVDEIIKKLKPISGKK